VWNPTQSHRNTTRPNPMLSALSVDERLGSNIQTLTTPELMFRALLKKDGAQRLVLART
jgi:hypothetical protein